MKILLPIIWHGLTHCVARAFEGAGHEVHVVDWRKQMKHHGKGSVEAFCIREAEYFRPDIAFCQFQQPDVISPKFPQALKDMGCFAINWSGDVRHPIPDWYVNLAPYFGCTAFTNMVDVDIIRALGYNAEFIQIGYDPALYHSRATGQRRGVVFIGNNYGGAKYAESESRRKMVITLAQLFNREFKVYGVGWSGLVRPRHLGGYVAEPGDAIILRSALVAVGWDHFHRAGFASDRLLRATASGCATVNQYYEGIADEHPNVTAVRTIDEMVDMVSKRLNEPRMSEDIGLLSAEHTRRAHTWDARVPLIIDIARRYA